MARGKHSAASAVRRAEAAHEHIDRLTDELVEAKIRARRFEQDALRLPAVEAELRRVRQLMDAGTSDEIERLRSAHNERVADLQDKNDALVRFCGGVMTRAGVALSGDEWNRLSELGDLGVALGDLIENRTGRRQSRYIRRPGRFFEEMRATHGPAQARNGDGSVNLEGAA